MYISIYFKINKHVSHYCFYSTYFINAINLAEKSCRPYIIALDLFTIYKFVFFYLRKNHVEICFNLMDNIIQDLRYNKNHRGDNWKLSQGFFNKQREWELLNCHYQGILERENNSFPIIYLITTLRVFCSITREYFVKRLFLLFSIEISFTL